MRKCPSLMLLEFTTKTVKSEFMPLKRKINDLFDHSRQILNGFMMD